MNIILLRQNSDINMCSLQYVCRSKLVHVGYSKCLKWLSLLHVQITQVNETDLYIDACIFLLSNHINTTYSLVQVSVT